VLAELLLVTVAAMGARAVTQVHLIVPIVRPKLALVAVLVGISRMGVVVQELKQPV
jgi:hypothetical protein